MDCTLAIDIGTQSVRAGVLDQDLTILEREQEPVSIQIRPGGCVEMNAEDIWSALVKVCSRLKQKDRVLSVVFSTLCPSLLPLDGDGSPLHPIILHLDRRSGKQAQWAIDTIGEEAFLSINGNLPVPGGISLTSILWLKEHFPDIYRRKDVCFGHATTFVLKQLTGSFFIDPSNASFTGLYDTVGYSDWDDRLCEPLQIDREKLPLIRNSNSICGELLPEAATILGLKAGLPIVTGANDTTCATVGAGVTNSGDLLNTSGTVDILVLCLEQPLVSREHLLRAHAYPGKWLAMRTVGAGGGSLEWFRNNFCREISREEFYSAYLDDLLENGPRPSASFLPFLSGNRHQVGDRTASFEGLTLNTTRDEMLLALLYGIVTFQFEALQRWEKDVKLSNVIHHVGGGAKSSYTRFKQNMLPGYHLEMQGETTLTGAARIAFDTLAP